MKTSLVVAVTALVIGTLVAVGRARAGESGEVTFRLELRGTVIAGDSFFLAVNASNGTIVSPGMLCGPRPVNADEPACAATRYGFAVEASTSLPVGTQLAYTFSRDPAYGGDADGAEVIHTGTVTVGRSPQSVSVIYEYGRSTLPDTAMPLRAEDYSP